MVEALELGARARSSDRRAPARAAAAQVGKPEKREFTPPAKDTSLNERIASYVGDRLAQPSTTPTRQPRSEATDALSDEAVAHFAELPTSPAKTRPAADEVARPSRTCSRRQSAAPSSSAASAPTAAAPSEIRPIWTEVGVLPRAHGSAIFTRGQTQVLSVATLGSTGEEQMLDGLGLEDTKRYIHHYNFPPFSTGEVRRCGARPPRHRPRRAGRARALPVLPDQDRVPLRDPRRVRGALLQRLVLDGLRLRQHAGADGRRRADQGAGRGHRDGPGHRGWQSATRS